MEDSQTYFFVATCIASIFGFVLAFILNRFVNKLDNKLDQYDKLFVTMQKEISELSKIVAVHDSDIQTLKGEKPNNKKR